MPALPPDTVVAYTDGGSRGNPGPAGFGVRAETADGALLEEFCEPVGIATNNVAEYRGLLAALVWAAEHGHRRLHVRSDSQLLVRQMRGEYRVKNPGLQPLYRQAREMLERFDRVSFEHVPREQNRDADRLANLAMDSAAASEPEDAPGTSSMPIRATGSPAKAGSHIRSGSPRHVGRGSRQDHLPFDDRLPDNSPSSPDLPGNTRKSRS